MLALIEHYQATAMDVGAKLATLTKAAIEVAGWDGLLRPDIVDLPEVAIDVRALLAALESIGIRMMECHVCGIEKDAARACNTCGSVLDATEATP